jgi:hypothetical protein
MLRRGGRRRESGRQTRDTSPDFDAREPDLDEDDDFNTEFWSRRLDDPRPDTSPRLETPPRPSRRVPSRAAPVARDKPAVRPTVDETGVDREAELAEFADATKAELHRVAMHYESAAEARRKAAAQHHETRLAELADATKAELARIAAQLESSADTRRNEAAERHEARLAELADATKAELSGIASRFERAVDARLDEAERHEVKLAELADATKAELARIATRFERVAADRIAQAEEITLRTAAQGHEISERMADLDRREAEFTRRLEEGLEHLDSQLAAWRRELTQSRRERGAAVDGSAVDRLTELVKRVDEHHGSFGRAMAERVSGLENALAVQRRATQRPERVEELENALAAQRRARERRRTVHVENGAAEDHAHEIHWMPAK